MKLIIAAFLALGSASAFAAGGASVHGSAPKGWTRLADGDGFQVYISDRAVPKATPGGWVLWEYDATQTMGDLAYRSVVTRYQVRCDQAKAVVTSTTWYAGENMAGNYRRSPVPRDVNPVAGSTDAQVVAAFCARH
jgi:hypothetical protein